MTLSNMAPGFSEAGNQNFCMNPFPVKMLTVNFFFFFLIVKQRYHLDIELSSGPFVAHGPAGSSPCFQTGGTVMQLIQKEGTGPPDQLWRHYSRIAFLLCLSATCFVTCHLLFCPSALHQPLLKMMAYFSVHLFYGRRRQ